MLQICQLSHFIHVHSVVSCALPPFAFSSFSSFSICNLLHIPTQPWEHSPSPLFSSSQRRITAPAFAVAQLLEDPQRLLGGLQRREEGRSLQRPLCHGDQLGGLRRNGQGKGRPLGKLGIDAKMLADAGWSSDLSIYLSICLSIYLSINIWRYKDIKIYRYIDIWKWMPKAWTRTQKCCNGWWIAVVNNDWWWEDYVKSPTSLFFLAVAKSPSRQNVLYGQCSVPNFDALSQSLILLQQSIYNFIDDSFADPSGFHLIIGQMVQICPNVGTNSK